MAPPFRGYINSIILIIIHQRSKIFLNPVTADCLRHFFLSIFRIPPAIPAKKRYPPLDYVLKYPYII